MKIKWIITTWSDCVTFEEPNPLTFDITIDKHAIYLGGPRYQYSKFIKRMKFTKVY